MKAKNQLIKNSTEKERAYAVVKKISTQRPHGADSNLIFAVFQQAVRDMYNRNSKSNWRGAINYLKRKNIRELEILGIDTEWARSLFKKADTEAMQ